MRSERDHLHKQIADFKQKPKMVSKIGSQLRSDSNRKKGKLADG